MRDWETSLGGRLRNGEPEALNELAVLYGSRLLRAAWFLCRDGIEAQDLVQETFAEAMASARRFAGRSALYSWLYGILRRRFLLQCRRRRRFANWLWRFGRPEDALRGAGPAMSPAATEEKLGPLLAAVQGLSLKHREVLLLRYIEGLKVSAIASLLSVSPGTVKSRLHYSLRRVRLSLRPEAEADVDPTAEKAHEM